MTTPPATAATAVSDFTALRRQWRNILVVGHRPNRLPADREIIAQSLREVVREVNAIATESGSAVRIVTGLEDGTDHMGAAVAADLDLPLHIAAVCPRDDSPAWPVEPERQCFFTAECPAPLPERWIAAMDEVKLDVADLMIIVWDGGPPRGTSGGAVRLLVEALQRQMPVVWIDAREPSAGAICVLDATRLEGWRRILLDVSEQDVERVRTLFVRVDRELSGALKRLLHAPWDQEPLRRFDRHLRDRALDPAERPVRDGFWHSHVFALLTAGCWKRRKKGVLQPYREPEDGKVVVHSLLPPRVWEAFDRMDRVASRAAFRHRDAITIIYLAASLAVFAAIAGALVASDLIKPVFGVGELLALGAIVVVLHRDGRRPLSMHGAWLSFRQAAEALRMSAILHPQLASLTELQRMSWQSARVATQRPDLKTEQENVLNHWTVAQLLRDVGLPTAEPGKPFVLAARRQHSLEQLLSMISDQRQFHLASRRRHECLHKVLHRGAEGIFWVVLGVIILHLLMAILNEASGWLGIPEGAVHVLHALHGWSWVLLITAGFPALAASVHGIQSTLEVQRVADRSEAMSQELSALERAVAELASQPDFDPMGLRALAKYTAELMYREHSGWAELMRSQRLEGAV
jgi:hypothetical protein